MILVDSPVWIDHLRDRGDLDHVQRLRAAFGQTPICVGDLILVEVMQGVPDEPTAALVERLLRQFDVVSLVDADLAVRAAKNYRALRQAGVTLRKTMDLLIGTWCIERAIPLLHADRDFDVMARHLGLAVV